MKRNALEDVGHKMSNELRKTVVRQWSDFGTDSRRWSENGEK